MIYHKFRLTGTAQQIAITKAALDALKFDYTKLKFPVEPVEIGWRNLNAYSNTSGLISGSSSDIVRQHGGAHPSGDEHFISGTIDNRRYTMGVFYIGSGRMYIDTLLVNYPLLAMSTVCAEMAHAVDYFGVLAKGHIGLTDKMRNDITLLFHKGDPTPHGHTWWEVFDYGKEYFTLIGEAFMQAFTIAYSDLEFDTYGWTHYITKDQAPELRRIIGVERTDYVPPLPTPIPEPVIVPVDEIQPVPAPVIPEPIPTINKYEKFGKSKVFHAVDKHYPNKEGEIIENTAGLRPCLFCKRKNYI